jgi:hypothetical protein
MLRSVNIRLVVGGQPTSWVTSSPKWPMWPASATGVASVSVGGVGDLLDAKAGLGEGLSAKALTAGIGHFMVVLFVVSVGVFLLNVQRARASPSWATLLRVAPTRATQ